MERSIRGTQTLCIEAISKAEAKRLVDIGDERVEPLDFMIHWHSKVNKVFKDERGEKK